MAGHINYTFLELSGRPLSLGPILEKIILSKNQFVVIFVSFPSKSRNLMFGIFWAQRLFQWFRWSVTDQSWNISNRKLWWEVICWHPRKLHAAPPVIFEAEGLSSELVRVPVGANKGQDFPTRFLSLSLPPSLASPASSVSLLLVRSLPAGNALFPTLKWDEAEVKLSCCCRLLSKVSLLFFSFPRWAPNL